MTSALSSIAGGRRLGGASDAPSERFSTFVAFNLPRIEAALKECLPVSAAAGTERFNEALSYAVFPGGKRLRPLLTLAGSALGGASGETALKLSCAIEFIHTSSLVFDDLPCMDDAELRRNSPPLHIVYDEGIAILVAVALLNQAYALFAASARDAAQAERLPRLIEEVAGCIGSSGMIAGQAVEFANSGTRADESVAHGSELKTTGLMRLMMIAGGIICGAHDDDIVALATFGESFGRAYQIHDDLADRSGDRQTTGKNVGQDARHMRPSIIRGLSGEEVGKLVASEIETGKAALARFKDRPEAQLLRDAVDYIFAGRDRVGASSNHIV